MSPVSTKKAEVFPPGPALFLRGPVDRAWAHLSRQLRRLGCRPFDPQGSESAVLPGLQLQIRLLSHGEWCAVQPSGGGPGRELTLQALTGEQPYPEVVDVRLDPEAQEYAFTFFREGKPVEAFRGAGPGLGTCSFSSDLRRVDSRKIIRCRPFLEESLRSLGISSREEPGTEKTLFFTPPSPKSFFRSVLGALWEGE